MISEREGREGAGLVRAKTTSLDAYRCNQKENYGDCQKKRYFLKTMVSIDMIETISWIAEKNLERAAIIGHLTFFA